MRDGVELPAYRGDAVNDYAFDPVARIPDPRRLLRAYHTSSATLNSSGRSPRVASPTCGRCTSGTAASSPTAANARYEAMARDIDRAMRFMAACGGDFDALRTVEFYSSHEGLLLDYERPMTRIDSRTGLRTTCRRTSSGSASAPASSTARTSTSCSRVRNPIGVKLGPTTTPRTRCALIERLNPEGEPGRLTFVTPDGGRNDPG